jgi:cellulose synthase/poly-beta-1,6-N-acetylglucosamine synthase-like glycosyltransferase
MLNDILFIVAILYSIMLLLFAAAALRAQYSAHATRRPRVSIIIAARNEEGNLPRCLDAICSLSYPRELLEVIVVDDHSTDSTRAIINRYAERYSNLRLLEAERGTGTLQGKANAVSQGIDVSRGEIVLFTDADCLVPPRWVEETVKYYTSDNVGIVAGFTSLEGSGWFAQIQAIDWFSLFSAAAGLVRLRFPTTAVGTNLSVRRSAYEAVGGYRSIPFSVTEDYALFHAVTGQTAYRAVFPLDAKTLVRSKPCVTWRELYRQKKRWFLGGRGMEARQILIFGIPYLLNVLFLVAPLGGLSSVFWWSAGLKVFSDFLMTLPSLLTFHRSSLLRSFLLYEIYFYVYVLIFPVIVIVGKPVIWKERSFAE